MKLLREKIAKIKGKQNLTGKEVYEIIKNNPNEIGEVINEFIENLNIGLSNYVNIFKPEAICIGGSFTYYKDLLLEKLITKMNEENLSFYGEIPEIMVAKCGNDAGIIGATIC